MQKIAVVIPKYGLIGGAEQFVSELTERIASSGRYEFHVFANRRQSVNTAIKFHHIPIISFPKYLTTLSFAYFAQLRLRQNKASLIHSHERIFSADIFTMHGIPHRYWVHNVRQKKMSLYDRATDWVEKELVYNGNCRKFIAVSRLTRDIFLRQYNVNPDKVAVINPGVDLSDYANGKDKMRDAVRSELGLAREEFLIVFASMNFEIKGLDAIIAALAHLKNSGKKFTLLVAGKGNEKKYRKLIDEAELAGSVIFTGPVSKEKLNQYYLAGDMYIMLSKFDTFGMVVLEAMAAGLPVIISSNVGAQDLVQEGQNGFIVQNTSDAGYIAAKIELLLDKNVRVPMSEFALQTAAQNTWDNVAEKYLAIYDEIIAAQTD